MNKIGHDISQNDLDLIMKEHDIEKNDYISFFEFKALLLDLQDVKDAEKYELKTAKREDIVN
jgi:proline dehydrogenase